MARSPCDDGQYRARRRALAGAREVLRNHSYRTFSVERVAKAAGLSRRTLYNQFEDRADLYHAVRLEQLAEIETALPRQISRNLPLPAAIEQFVGEACRILAGDSHAQLRVAILRDGAELPWLIAVYRERITLPLEWAVERCLLQQAHGNALLVEEPAGQAQRLVAMMLASIAEPAAFHPDELTAIFLNRLRTPARAHPNDIVPVDYGVMRQNG